MAIPSMGVAASVAAVAPQMGEASPPNAIAVCMRMDWTEA